jgi:H+/Cl- antiporter ClcA
MKKLFLPLIIFIGVVSGLAGITLIRLSKSMEDWEASWDEGKEED